MKLQQDNAPDYRKLVTDPNFLEDVAIMIQEGGIDHDIVDRSLGYNIPYRWSLWKPTIDALRDLSGEKKTYREFETLAKQIAPNYPDSIKVDDDGEIVWREFID